MELPFNEILGKCWYVCFKEIYKEYDQVLSPKGSAVAQSALSASIQSMQSTPLTHTPQSILWGVSYTPSGSQISVFTPNLIPTHSEQRWGTGEQQLEAEDRDSSGPIANPWEETKLSVSFQFFCFVLFFSLCLLYWVSVFKCFPLSNTFSLWVNFGKVDIF